MIPFIAGIVSFNFHQPSLSGMLVLFLFFLGAALILSLSFLQRYSIIPVVLASAVLGMLAAHSNKCSLPDNHVRNLMKSDPALFAVEEMEIEGVITVAIEPSERGTDITVRLSNLIIRGSKNDVRGNMRLFIAHKKSEEKTFYVPGDRISAFARVRLPRSFANEGAFDYAAYLKAQGIDILGSVKSRKLVNIDKKRSWNPLRKLSVFRQRLIHGFHELCQRSTDTNDTAGLILAMTLGSREDICAETSRTMRMSGIYHIIAVSGMNFGIIAFIFFRFMRSLRIPDKAVCACTGCVLIAYLVMSGGRSSAVRAVVMSVSYLISKSIRRKPDIMNCISCSACAMLLFNPALIHDPGFQLTFAATASLVLWYAPISKMTSRIRFITPLLSATASAQIGVIPIIAYHFNTITYFSLLSNMLAVPSLAVIIPIGILCEILAFIAPSIAQLLFIVLVFIMRGVLWFCSLYIHFPFLAYRIPTPHLLIVFMYYLSAMPFLFCISSKQLRIATWAKMCSFSFFVIALFVISTYPFSPDLNEQLQVTFLDVGQGESAFIVSPDGRSLLVDAGSRTQNMFDAGEMVVSKYLFSHGFKSIDTIIASHLHSDHAGGIPSVVENFSVKQVFVSEAEQEEMIFHDISRICRMRRTELKVVKENDTIEWRKMKATIFNPVIATSKKASQNERSLIIMISYGNVRFLFTGDATTAVEEAMIESEKELECDVLKVGHHGSSDASSDSFLARTDPTVCVISVGEHNQWGHPSREVIDRIERSGSILLRTDRDGAISVCTDGRSFYLKSHLNRNYPFCIR